MRVPLTACTSISAGMKRNYSQKAVALGRMGRAKRIGDFLSPPIVRARDGLMLETSPYCHNN